MTSIVRIT